jgi:hypothetical protein
MSHSYPPIRREDIQPGDHIRLEYHQPDGDDMIASEFIGHGPQNEDGTYFLMKRPVTLPTTPGPYRDRDGDIWRIFAGTTTLVYLEPPRAVTGAPNPEGYVPFERLYTDTEFA